MKKVLLHFIQYDIGGPNTVLDCIENSYLSTKYEFVRICQQGGCGYNPFKAIRFVRHYTRLINAQHADCIYISGLQYVGFLMTLAARLSNVKRIVLSVHGSDWDVPERSLRRAILKYIIEPIEVHMADKVFTVCLSEQHIVKALRCCRKGANCGVIYNTFPDIDEKSIASGKLHNMLHIQPDKVIVSTVGRVTERKGHAYIIDAIRKCNDDSLVFVIIGDGDYLDQYRRQCADAIDKSRLHLLGNRDDVYELLRDTDIFLFATLNENHSMALLEAVNMRCAAIVTNVGGNTETIRHGISGIVIPPADSDAILEGLQRLKDPVLRQQYTDAAYESSKKSFSVDKTLGKLDKLFA